MQSKEIKKETWVNTCINVYTVNPNEIQDECLHEDNIECEM